MKTKETELLAKMPVYSAPQATRMKDISLGAGANRSCTPGTSATVNCGLGTMDDGKCNVGMSDGTKCNMGDKDGGNCTPNGGTDG